MCEKCGAFIDAMHSENAADREVAIERLRTNRDIEVARINASAAKDIAETEAENETAHAEGVVEGIGAVLDAAAGPPAETPEAAAEVADVAEVAELPEAGPESPEVAAPPEVAESAEETARAKGWWDGYR